MSVVQNTLIGRSRGSIGGVTFATWKGLNVAKGKPVSVANPNTEPQQIQRARLRKGVALYRANSAILNIGFRQQAIHKSAYNAFMSANMLTDAVNGGQSSPPYGDPLALRISKGSLTPTALTVDAASEGTSTVTVTYSDVTTGDQFTTDQISISIYDANAVLLATVIEHENRSGLGTTVTTNRALVLGEKIYIHGFFSQASSGKVSDDFVIEFTVTE